jgi:hypothetical protein
MYISFLSYLLYLLLGKQKVLSKFGKHFYHQCLSPDHWPELTSINQHSALGAIIADLPGNHPNWHVEPDGFVICVSQTHLRSFRKIYRQ